MKPNTLLQRQEGKQRSGPSKAAQKAAAHWVAAALEVEQAMWAPTEKPLSDDTRFVLYGQHVRVTTTGHPYHLDGGWVERVEGDRMWIRLACLAEEAGKLVEVSTGDIKVTQDPESEVSFLLRRQAELRYQECVVNDRLLKVVHRKRLRLMNEVGWLTRNARVRSLAVQVRMARMGYPTSSTALVLYTGTGKGVAA